MKRTRTEPEASPGCNGRSRAVNGAVTGCGPPTTRHSGLTLFEVVLALSIFLGAAAALSQLYSTGSQASVRARLHAQAVLLAKSKLAEVAAGIQPLDAVANMPFDDPGLADWSWGLVIGEGPHIDVLAAEVTVAHHATSSMGNLSWSVVRYVRDPQLFLDAALEASTLESTP